MSSIGLYMAKNVRHCGFDENRAGNLIIFRIDESVYIRITYQSNDELFTCSEEHIWVRAMRYCYFV